MPALPILELTFRNVAGDPWEGEAVARFNGEPGNPFPVREGLTRKQRQDLRWYIEDFLDFPEGGYLTRARRIEREMDEYGPALWEGLQGIQTERWLGTVQAQRGGRLELRAATKKDETAFRSPWELLRIGDRLLHQLRVTVVRRTKTELPRLHGADTTQGLRVLVVVCRPDEEGFLDPRYTPQAILDALAARPEVQVDFCRPSTLDALRAELLAADDRGAPYHVVHFDGHGGTGVLCFEKEDGRTDFVRARRFGDLMSEFDIPLVVLEACRTATPSFAQETVASELLRRGVGTVIAMGHAVHVDMTQSLMSGFYGALAQGVAIGEALRRARNDVYSTPARRLSATPEAPTEDLLDWFVPQLYQGGDDPVLLPVTPQVSLARAAEPRLVNFPPPPRAGFEGRGRELHRLERALLRHPVAVLHGPGGMGKTALAREAAHWWTRTGWFEEAIFVSFEGRPSPEKVVTEVGLALEGQDFYKQEDPAAWVAGQLTQRRLLLVWDNFESVLPAFQKGAPMPPGLEELAERWTAGGSKILLTCRASDVPLPGAQPVDLWALSGPEALGLLARLLEKLGKGRTERAKLGWDAETLQPLIAATGGHPLALELLSPYLEQFGPAKVAADLGPLLAKAEQKHEEGRNRSLWASLEFSIEHLSKEAREALPAVALMAGGCVEVMARMTAGLDDAAWGQVRGELERTGMVRVSGPFLRPHPVLAEVEALAPTPEVEERFLAVVRQLCGEFDRLVRSSDPKPALATMAVAEVVARRAVDRALDAGSLETAGVIVLCLLSFFRVSGRTKEGVRLVHRVHQQLQGEGQPSNLEAFLTIAAAKEQASENPSGAVTALEEFISRLEMTDALDLREAKAMALQTLGEVNQLFLGRPAAALKPLEEAELHFYQVEQESAASTSNRGAVLGTRASSLRLLGRYEEALMAAKAGLALDRDRGDTNAVARALGRVAHILLDAGRLAEAEETLEEVLNTAREAADKESIGITYQQLAVLADALGRYDEAEMHCRQSLESFQRAGDELRRRETLNLLGEIYRHRGNLREAQVWLEQARTVAEEQNDLAGQAAARGNLALVYSMQAEESNNLKESNTLLHRAIEEERKVLSLFEELGQPSNIAQAHSNLAGRLWKTTLQDEAEEHALKALSIWEQSGSPEVWRPIATLESIAKVRGDQTAAAEWRRRKEEAQAEARERAGVGGLGQQQIGLLLQLAHAARAHGMPFGELLAQTDAPDDLLDQIRERDPWLLTHLQALAGGETRPEAKVPALYSEVVDAAWAAVGRG